MTDIISRAAAIDALDALCDRECEYSKKQRSVMCGACHLGTAFDVIEQLPSASFENHDEIKSYSKDTISRQAAVEHLRNNIAYMQAFGCDRSITLIKELPSAQLSPCDVCKYAPPSSMDGKPCAVCPAEGR